ncbi:hypothetical protein [Halorussus pelagicus]|uniref:hypothetical protein n=1 Tax=Halorussus pelagicus TaxID=2505977 RepID=UPI000FFC44D0|nr:hypothetical protein [Halorussus pelagicus]
MSDQSDTWVVLLTAGMSLLVGAVLFLDAAPWYVRYGTYAVALGLSLLAVRRGDRESASA